MNNYNIHNIFWIFTKQNYLVEEIDTFDFLVNTFKLCVITKKSFLKVLSNILPRTPKLSLFLVFVNSKYSRTHPSI